MPSAANTANSQRAATTAPPCALLTTTPARPAPNAPEINCTVLIAAAAAPPSSAPSTQLIAHADRCGQAAPMPAPVIVNATVHRTTTPIQASSTWVTAPNARPTAMISGAAATTREMTRPLLSDALAISLTVQPTASAAPRKPATTGTRCARRWPNNGTYMSAIAEAISTAMV